MLEAMERNFANPSSENHSAGWSARACVEAARSTIARSIGCGANEIIFTSGATEADNIGVLGAALGAPEDRRRILVSAIEHKAVLEPAFAAESLGFNVELLPVDRNGLLDLEYLRTRLDDDVAVVSVMWVNNEIGTIQPIKEIARASSAVGAFVHTDATQAPAALNIDVAELGVDAASFSSHKIYGPKGIGALYVSAAAPWRPKPLMFGGGQEEGLRPGTLPTFLCAGFAEAFSIISAEDELVRARTEALRNQLAEALKNRLSEVRETALGTPKHPGNLHIRFEGVDAYDLLFRLQPYVAASTGSACTSGQIQESHVLKALGMSPQEAAQGVRLSVGRFSTPNEIAHAATLIASVVEDIRGVEGYDNTNLRAAAY